MWKPFFGEPINQTFMTITIFFLLNHLSATLNNGVGVTRCQDPFWMIKTYLDLLLIL